MSGYLGWARAIDDLYRSVVADPGSHDDERLAEWLADLGSLDSPPREVARELRRALAR